MDIARSDWPHFYPEFLPQVVRLVQAKDTACLGLTMLLTASEELATPREDLATARAAELRKLMAGQAPEVVAAVPHQKAVHMFTAFQLIFSVLINYVLILIRMRVTRRATILSPTTSLASS